MRFPGWVVRLLCVVCLLVFVVLEIGPVPITGLLLVWVVLFRPHWFYDLVLAIYAGKLEQ